MAWSLRERQGVLLPVVSRFLIWTVMTQVCWHEKCIKGVLMVVLIIWNRLLEIINGIVEGWKKGSVGEVLTGGKWEAAFRSQHLWKCLSHTWTCICTHNCPHTSVNTHTHMHLHIHVSSHAGTLHRHTKKLIRTKKIPNFSSPGHYPLSITALNPHLRSLSPRLSLLQFSFSL